MSEDNIVIIPDDEDVTDAEDGASPGKRVRILTFSLGQENYAISLDQAKEVIQPSSITRVPNSPDFIAGVINLRGEIIAVLDIRHFFGLGGQEKVKDAKILITDVTGSYAGIVIDKVKAIVEIEEEAIQPPLATLKGKLVEYTKGEIQMGNDIVVLLDLSKVLNNEAIGNLRKGGS